MIARRKEGKRVGGIESKDQGSAIGMECCEPAKLSCGVTYPSGEEHERS